VKPQTPHDETWKVKHAGRENANFLEVHNSDPEVAKHFKKGEPERRIRAPYSQPVPRRSEVYENSVAEAFGGSVRFGTVRPSN